MPSPIISRNVQTTLRYHDPVPGNWFVNDYRKPDAKDKMNDFDEAARTYHVQIQDVRGREQDFSIFDQGFTYVHDPVPALQDCKTEKEIFDLMVPHTEEMVAKLTGAARCISVPPRIRNEASGDRAKLAKAKGPTVDVHSDFTIAGALQYLARHIVVPDASERENLMSSGRIMIINVWRPLKPIKKDPLAVCDWNSVTPKKDYIRRHHIFQDGHQGWTEFNTVVHNPEHQWYYLHSQSPEEPLVFVQYDSYRDDGMSNCHCSFVDKEYKDEDVRESVEVKVFAFIPKAEQE